MPGSRRGTGMLLAWVLEERESPFWPEPDGIVDSAQVPGPIGRNVESYGTRWPARRDGFVPLVKAQVMQTDPARVRRSRSAEIHRRSVPFCGFARNIFDSGDPIAGVGKSIPHAGIAAWSEAVARLKKW